jgi:septal ring factor EnvC (AmiA/AmiB activator)
MEAEKSELELTISNATKETRTLKKTIASVKTEAKELRDNLTELSNLLDSTDLDNSQVHFFCSIILRQVNIFPFSCVL